MALNEIILSDILSQGPGAEQLPIWGKVCSEYRPKPHNWILFLQSTESKSSSLTETRTHMNILKSQIGRYDSRFAVNRIEFVSFLKE